MGSRASVGIRGVYPNWPDPDLEGWIGAYHGGNLDRLVEIKRRYDPDGFFASTSRSRVEHPREAHCLTMDNRHKAGLPRRRGYRVSNEDRRIGHRLPKRTSGRICSYSPRYFQAQCSSNRSQSSVRSTRLPSARLFRPWPVSVGGRPSCRALPPRPGRAGRGDRRSRPRSGTSGRDRSPSCPCPRRPPRPTA